MKITFGGRDGGGEDCCFSFVVATPADAAVSIVLVTTSESHFDTNIFSEGSGRVITAPD